ncbi:GNAT superfamily N-acetyltransferase [Conyzicola nivalis]|uniref:GNAT superfamily N-acetyltransferase n=1 Tax=Conyzicola nivalis TaxID=1477021 RepID=A0ABV2QP81_9MICO
MPFSSFTFENVSWDDHRAARLRSVMDAEMSVRYANHTPEPEPAEVTARRTASLAVDPADVRAVVLVLDDDGTPIAHAALRELRGDWEVKRVIVSDAHRGRGIARALMNHLESLARAAGVSRLILQTGDRQPDAVAVYERVGYTPIPIYEPYVETIPNSLCFEKVLAA